MKKWNSAFTSLAFSYMSIVLVIVLALCSVFYIYFSGSYKEELRSKNQLILENTARTIETSVLQRVQQIYLELSLGKKADLRWAADSAFQTDLSRAVELQELLKSVAASSSDIVQGIHIYEPKHHVLLSSIYGMNFQADQRESAVYYKDWMEEMRSSTQSSIWTRARWVPEDIHSSVPGGSGENLITYAHSYPFQSSGADSDLIIAIDVKESAIQGIIENMIPSQYESTFIWDPSGSVVAGLDQVVAEQPGTSGLHQWMREEESGSFNDKLGSTSYVVSYETLPSTGWKIYSAVPASLFYEQSLVVNKVILAICFLAILLGVVMSGIWAKAIYSPIKRLVGRIKDLSGWTPEPAANAYTLIDTAFVKLNDKVSTLEETLQASSPLIKRNAVLHLLHSGRTGLPHEEELKLLGIGREYRHYACLLLNSREALAPLSSGNMQAVMERLIHQLESLHLPECRVIAEELPDKNIVVILCADESADVLLEQLSEQVLPEARQFLGLDTQLSQSSWADTLSDIPAIYTEAQTLLKYAYFLPGHHVLKDRRLLEREDSLEEIPQTMLLKFKDKLQARHYAEIEAAVEQMVQAMREGRYPADYCHFILASTVFIYSDYLKSVRYKDPSQGHSDLYNQYLKVTSIQCFQEWLLDSVSTFLAHTEKRNSDRALSTLESAKHYIEDHLSGDLSLEAVSSQVFLSAKYLSRLFKEELGITYTDYVTSRRMERAKTLIEKQNMTVEQIASTVGYATAAYFIKKFKDNYGCTPGNYLRSMANRA
ncbi:AraC family transcriptional regulator [Paenibacillus lemnae]|uniref:AraC family transcriptional regulator n=1 Tax=Paenibacillus lemnae TaxID=1330551 RepID=A0A848M2I1_PAELE|nr:AraC family transcriptional regulator [Paenibacillus lemnae]